MLSSEDKKLLEMQICNVLSVYNVLCLVFKMSKHSQQSPASKTLTTVPNL